VSRRRPKQMEKYFATKQKDDPFSRRIRQAAEERGFRVREVHVDHTSLTCPRCNDGEGGGPEAA
jgi:hypothetical protein